MTNLSGSSKQATTQSCHFHFGLHKKAYVSYT
jgi:hypothetical protein